MGKLIGELIDYVEGMFSKVKLSDGSKIFVSVEGNSMRISKLNFWGIPSRELGRISMVFNKEQMQGVAKKLVNKYDDPAEIEKMKMEGRTEEDIEALRKFSEDLATESESTVFDEIPSLSQKELTAKICECFTLEAVQKIVTQYSVA